MWSELEMINNLIRSGSHPILAIFLEPESRFWIGAGSGVEFMSHLFFNVKMIFVGFTVSQQEWSLIFLPKQKEPESIFWSRPSSQRIQTLITFVWSLNILSIPNDQCHFKKSVSINKSWTMLCKHFYLKSCSGLRALLNQLYFWIWANGVLFIEIIRQWFQ